MALMIIRADRHVYDEVGMGLDGDLSLFDGVKSVSVGEYRPALEGSCAHRAWSLSGPVPVGCRPAIS